VSDAITLSSYVLGDMRVEYLQGTHGHVGLRIIPVGVPPIPIQADDVDSVVQIAVTGSAASGGFAAGHTMRNGATVESLRYHGQTRSDNADGTTIVTTFGLPEGLTLRHVLEFPRDRRALRVRTEVENTGSDEVSLDLLSSFSVMGLSSLPQRAGGEALVVHRVRSVWSAEGRVVTQTIEDLQLETSWSRHGVRVERFGQTGTLPVRKFFPFVAIEDPRNDVTWAAQLVCPSSWQMELYRRTGSLCLSGGLADYEFGHWRKALGPGAVFESPWAFLTVVRGDLDSASQRLLDLHQDSFERLRPGAAAPQFNEFCTTWGEPSHDKVVKMVEAVRGKGLKYFVIDAGWYSDPLHGWEECHGDWVVSSALFPQGLEKTIEVIRSAGMEPGIWFEIETCGRLSRAYGKTEHLLTREGIPITSGFRRFWDMEDPWVLDYLAERVIGLLRRYGFQYLKIDYNESAGVGCDGAESPGEALRRKVRGTEKFFQRIRESVPGLVIETCASGGHRLEPSMLALSDVASFSDAHECLEIPVIAANLHRVMLPAQSLIWAVLRKEDSLKRIVYSLVSTFLGVPCLSGDVAHLKPEVWDCVEDALAFYRGVVGIIEGGLTTFHGPTQRSYRNLQGWQGVVRIENSGNRALVVIHSFSGTFPTAVEIFLGGRWKVEDVFCAHGNTVWVQGESLWVKLVSDFEAVALRLSREQPYEE